MMENANLLTLSKNTYLTVAPTNRDGLLPGTGDISNYLHVQREALSCEEQDHIYIMVQIKYNQLIYAYTHYQHYNSTVTFV